MRILLIAALALIIVMTFKFIVVFLAIIGLAAILNEKENEDDRAKRISEKSSRR